MDEFNIKLARMEMVARDDQKEEVCITFQFERASISFEIPIFLGLHDFDDTEMVKVARNILNQTFTQLAAQCQEWRLTDAELRELTRMNLRPTIAEAD